MGANTYEAFSITHAQLMDRQTAFDAVVSNAAADPLDIYGVSQGSLNPAMGEAQNEGDDVELSYWSWLNHCEVQVDSGYLSFPLLSSITGRPISSPGAAPNQLFGMDLYHESGVNLAPWPILIRMPSKDTSGLVRTLDFGLYRVTWQPITVTGPQYKQGVKCNMRGRATYSPVDELGNPFPDGKKRIGRMISRPAV